MPKNKWETLTQEAMVHSPGSFPLKYTADEATLSVFVDNQMDIFWRELTSLSGSYMWHLFIALLPLYIYFTSDAFEVLMLSSCCLINPGSSLHLFFHCTSNTSPLGVDQQQKLFSCWFCQQRIHNYQLSSVKLLSRPLSVYAQNVTSVKSLISSYCLH